MEIPSAETSIHEIVGTIHSIARANQPVGISIGRVITAPPKLQIAWNNIILDAEQLYIDQFLLPNYKRNLKGEEKIPNAEGNIRTNTQSKRGGVGKPRYTSHSHKIRDSYKADLEGDYTATALYTDCGLEVGDLVAILPLEDAQKFIVLSKLVYLPEFKFTSDIKNLR